MVSIIIPTYNAGPSLEALLACLGRQTVENELIIIDSESEDNTVKVARSYGVEPIQIKKEAFNHGATRNFAARGAKGDILVFLTQDSYPMDNTCLERLVEPLSDPFVAASYGRHVPKQDALPTERYSRLYNYPDVPAIKSKESIPSLGIKAFFFSNVCSAARTRDFKSVGGFPEDLIMFEDMLFAARLILGGYRIAYVSEARVLHSHVYSSLQHYQRYLDAGISFSMNPWFLKYARSTGAGFDFLKGEVRYLINQRALAFVPYALAEAIAKYVGYHVGLYYTKIPVLFRKRIVLKDA